MKTCEFPESQNSENTLTTFKFEIAKLLPLPENQKTFLEILKISKREVPIANLLTYFFNPNESHNLGDLFIRSLLETSCYNLKENIGTKELHLNGYLFRENMLAAIPAFSLIELTGISDVKVHSEKKTAEQKRIDIVIETKQFIIAIEFKINHVLNNPLHLYEKYILERYCKEETKPLFFVILTPQWKLHENLLVENKSFKQITLSSFVDRIKLNLSDDIKKKINDKDFSVFFLMDFIRTVENRKRHQDLREKLLKFPLILDLYNKLSVDSVLKELKGVENEQLKHAVLLVKNIDKEIETKLKSVLRELELKDTVMLPKRKCFEGCIILKIPKTEYAIKVRLSIEGWSLELWKKVEEQGYTQFLKSLYNQYIDFETSNSSIVLKINQSLSNLQLLNLPAAC